MIQVMGSLDLPLSTPSSLTLLRFTCLDGLGNVLKTASQEIETDTDGNYDFGLNNGQYCIEVLYGKTWECISNIEVTDSTTSPIDLNGLIDEASIPEPEPPIDETTAEQIYLALGIPFGDSNMGEFTHDALTDNSDIKNILENFAATTTSTLQVEDTRITALEDTMEVVRGQVASLSDTLVRKFTDITITDAVGEAQITHGLNTETVMVQVWDEDGEVAKPKIYKLSNNSILIDVKKNSIYTVVVMG